MKHPKETQHGLLAGADLAILANVTEALAEIQHGSITLVVQDARVIQMEVLKKIRFNEATHINTTSSGSIDYNALKDGVNKQIACALAGMKFGQITFQIKQARIAQVERLEKQRFPDLEGIHGDGI